MDPEALCKCGHALKWHDPCSKCPPLPAKENAAPAHRCKGFRPRLTNG